MTLEEKVEVIETTDSHASAIRPFDRILSDVLARKNENAPAPASQYAWQATAQAEPRRPSDNAAGETSSGSEKLRTEIIARVSEADAPKHQEKLKEMRAALDRWMKETKDLGAIPEAKFKQEQALRLLSEQRLAEIEAEYKQRLASAQVAYFSRLELELALAESEARLKQESEARRLADTALARTRDEAKASANAAALASEEAEKRIVELEGELEARDRDIEERTDALKSATLAWHEAERRIAELEDAIEKAEVAVRAREEAIAKRGLAEMEVALKAANYARDAAERKLAEVERTRVASFTPSGAPAAAAGHRLTGAEPREAEVKPRALESPLRKSPRGIKVEPARALTRSAKRGGSRSSLLTLGLSTESYAPAPTQDASRKEKIKLVGYVAAISLAILAGIVLGLTVYRLL